MFHREPEMKQREESSKYDSQRSIFDELRGVLSGDETLRGMLDITSRKKKDFSRRNYGCKTEQFFI